MVTKNLVLSRDCGDLFNYFNSEFNVLLSGQLVKGVSPPDKFYNPILEGAFNPFGTPDYWISLRKEPLEKEKQYRQNSFIQRFVVHKLITSKEFINFNANLEYWDFINQFLEYSQNGGSINFSHEKTRTNPPSPINLNLIKTETYNQYVDRCISRFQSDNIFIVNLEIDSTVKKEIEIIKQNSKDSKEIIEKTTVLIPNCASFPKIKELALNVCYHLEKLNINNYLIRIDTNSLDLGIYYHDDASHSEAN